MIRAAAAPDRFLNRGLSRFVARERAALMRSREAPSRAVIRERVRAAFGVELPNDLAQLMMITVGLRVGDFAPLPLPMRAPANAFSALRTAASAKNPREKKARLARARLTALLAGTVPFGLSPKDTLWIYVLGEGSSPSRGAIGSLDPAAELEPHLELRDASSFALLCALDETAYETDDAAMVMQAMELRSRLTAPGVAEQEGVRAAFERASELSDLLVGTDAALRRAAKKLAARPLFPPQPPALPRPRNQSGDSEVPSSTRLVVAHHGNDRVLPLALGALVEAFFRITGDELGAMIDAQTHAADRLVRDAAAALRSALEDKPRTQLARELSRRRRVALRAAQAATPAEAPDAAGRAKVTRQIIELASGTKPSTEPLATSELQAEAFCALGELGDPSVLPSLIARAVTGDIAAVDMLGALGDPRAIGPLTDILSREPQRYRVLEAASARALAALAASTAAPALRDLLRDNPMPTWREGIERGVLVREIVAALGELRDEEAGPLLLQVLESTSQEYRAILPIAAWALGRIRHLPALGTLERLLASPKEPATAEAIWAASEIGSAQPNTPLAARANALLEHHGSADPGIEVVRLTGLAKLHVRTGDGPRSSELRRALERALWEPAFRGEETSRRRVWAFRCLEALAALRALPRGEDVRKFDIDPYFLGHDAVRYFVTRDDHRVRRAAQQAFAAWELQVPRTRRYYSFVLDPLEERGGLDALHEALRDPLGVFRHNVATRLAERADLSSVRPLAEATARLFAEPPTSTYEYDDAPSHLVAFVRALARLNRPEGNDVLIEGLRGGHHQVRAVVAENAPDDERFVPELMAMLGDPRSFLRSRAERSLAALGVTTPRPNDRPSV